VVAGAEAPGRPPLGGPGLPPHAPAAWQRAWVSGRSSGPRRAAWHPHRSLGIPRTPRQCPLACAVRSDRKRCSDTHRWPLGPPRATVGGVGAGRWFYADDPRSSRGAPILSASGASPQPDDRLSRAVGIGTDTGAGSWSSPPRRGRVLVRREPAQNPRPTRRPTGGCTRGRIGRRRPRGACPVMRSRTAVQPPSWAERPPRKSAGQKANAARQSTLIPAESIRNRCTEAIGLCSSRLTVAAKVKCSSTVQLRSPDGPCNC
jgi:hypothetical protein